MKAMAFATNGGPEVLEEMDMPIPPLENDEALVEVRACALIHLDLWVRQGIPGTTPMPHVGGCETTGVVADVGKAVRNLKAGDRVMIAPGISCRHCWACVHGDDTACPDYRVSGYQTQGGFAEYAKAKAHDCIPIDTGWSFPEWAAVPLTFLTAWHMLVRHARLKPGEDVLIHAAGSGVGTAAIQIARLVGARVFATAGSDEKLVRAEELGAQFTINYTKDKFADRVLEITEKRGVDVIVEHVGSAVWKDSLRSLARGGRLVTCGATSGPEVSLDLRFFFTREIAVLGSYMGTRSELLEVLRLVERRELRPVIDRVFPMSQLAEAQRHMQDRKQFGKIVVEPDWDKH